MYKKTLQQLLFLTTLTYSLAPIHATIFSQIKEKKSPTTLEAPRQKDVILFDLTGILF
jgi:hypothetical protein